MSLITNKSVPEKITVDDLKKVETDVNDKLNVLSSSPLKWMGCKDKILDIFDSLYPNSKSKIITDLLKVNESNYDINMEVDDEIDQVGLDNSDEDEYENPLLRLLSADITIDDKNQISKNVKTMDGIKCFIEPFLGGATNSVYISQKYNNVEQFYGSDALLGLMNFYKTIEHYKDNFMDLFEQLRDNYDNKCVSINQKINYFNDVRKWYNDMGDNIGTQELNEKISVERAAAFYFLNIISPMKGYRVNTSGHYNGSASNNLMKCPVPEGSFEALSNLISKMYLVHDDYSASIDFIDYILDPSASKDRNTKKFPAEDIDPIYKSEEIYVYIDPPALTSQTPLDLRIGGNVPIFTHSPEYLVKLAEYCNKLTERSIKWLMSVEKTSSLTFFYKNYKYRTIESGLTNKGIRNPKKRIDEVFIRNYEL